MCLSQFEIGLTWRCQLSRAFDVITGLPVDAEGQGFRSHKGTGSGAGASDLFLHPPLHRWHLLFCPHLSLSASWSSHIWFWVRIWTWQSCPWVQSRWLFETLGNIPEVPCVYTLWISCNIFIKIRLFLLMRALSDVHIIQVNPRGSLGMETSMGFCFGFDVVILSIALSKDVTQAIPAVSGTRMQEPGLQ